MTTHPLRAAGAAGVFAIAAATLPMAAGAADTEALVQNALSAAPPSVAADAKVMNMKGEVLRDGKGAYTCFPFEGPGTDAMCLDGEWMRWAGAWMEHKDFKAEKVGLAYMLAGDSPSGGASNVDPFATGATPDNHWVVEGPHVMIITPDAAALDALPDDPNAGGPYVMWKGTPLYLHSCPVLS